MKRFFERYLGVCSCALQQNKNKFPCSETFRAVWDKMQGDRKFHCAVYDDRPKAIYKLRLTEDIKIEIVDKTLTSAKETWPLRYTYLKHVVENSEDYIAHPANLDWGWLRGARV